MSDASLNGRRRRAAGPPAAGTPAGAPAYWLGAVLVALIGAFMSILDSSIVNVALPTIMVRFNAGISSAQWVATAYLLALGVVVPLSGWLGDRLGLKRLYVLSLAVFVFGSLLCALSWNINSLIAARVVQAVGGGMIMPTTMAMVFRMVPRERIGSAMGVFGIALLVAPAVGPTLGGYLVQYVDWRWIFTINLPIGVAGILLSLVALPEFSRAEAGRLDVGGLITAAAGLFCLLLALSKGADWGWTSEATVLLLYGSAAFLALFVYLELTAAEPLLDLRVFRHPTFTLANMAIVVTIIGMYAGLFYLPLFLQSIRGLGAMRTGLLMMPGALVAGAMMPIAGRLYDRIGPRILVCFGLLLLALLTYTFRFLNLETALATITGWIMIRGMAIPLANMPAQTAALAVVPTELVGRASAMTNIINRVSSSFGIAVLTSVLNRRTTMHAAHISDHIVPWSPAVQDFVHRFAAGSGGVQTADRSAALAWLQSDIARLAFVKGIDDVFIIAAGLTLLGLVPAIFLKRGKGPGRTPGRALE
jgi:EmrB/QacA subfamily drug resistance transporter